MSNPPVDQAVAAAPPPSKRTPSRRTWLWVLVLALLAAGGGWYYQRSAAKEPAGAEAARAKGGKGAERALPVTLAEIGSGDIRVRLPALGNIVPRNQVVVHSRVDGPLLSLAFTEGQTIKAGELLAQIDPEPFKAALAQARGQLQRDNALLRNAKLDLVRYKDLLAQDSVAKQQFDTQEALVRQYEGTVLTDEGLVRSAELQLSYTTIRAPISGQVGLRVVDPGNMVHAADVAGLVTIAQMTPITAVFSVPEDKLPAILAHWRETKSLKVEAWDRDMKHRLAEGGLLAVDSQIDSTTGTIRLKAQFANADGSLFPSQFVNVRLLLETLPDVVVVPSAAVLQGDKGSYVYRVGEDMKVAAAPVKLGPVDGDKALVESGLARGDKIVVDGLDKLRDGALVEAIDPKAVDAPGRESKNRNGGRRPRN